MFRQGSIRTLDDIGKQAWRYRTDIAELKKYLRMVKLAAGNPEVDRRAAHQLWIRIKELVAKCQKVLDQEKATTRRSTKSGKAKQKQPQGEEQTPQGKRQPSRDVSDKA